MATSPISLSMPSGLDTNSIVEQLVQLEQFKVTRVENEKKRDQLKIDAYSKIRSLLTDIKTKSSDLSKRTSFDLFTSTSSNSDAVTIKGSSGGIDGQYDVRVFQTAASEKMVSADNRITDQTTSLSSQGIAVGDFSIDGVKISIGENDTIHDLRSKINNAVDEKGNTLDVSATVMKLTDDNFRLVLASKTTGSEGVEYKDLTGSTLQDLGIIQTADGEKGNVSQRLESADDLVSAWASLSTGASIRFSGIDHDGREVSGSFVKSEGTTMDDLIAKIGQMYHGAAEVATDDSGRLTITDTVSGSSKISLDTLDFGGVAYGVAVTETGREGRGVLSAGRDAIFSIEGMNLSSSTNTVDGFISGMTFELHSVVADEPVTVALKRDVDGITEKMKGLLTAYNGLVDYAKNVTKIASAGDGSESYDGDLRADMTVHSIINSVRSQFQQQFDELESGLQNFAMVGLKTDTKTGQFSLDEDKFKKAFSENVEAVQNLFITLGNADGSGIVLGRSTKETNPGTYEIEEVDGDHYRIRLAGSSEWHTSDKRVGDVMTFSSGPAKGLSVTSGQGSISGTVTFKFSKGLATSLSELITNMLDSNDGVVALRQKSIEAHMRSADKRIETLENRVERYRERLIREFSQMESVLSSIKQQSAGLVNAFRTQ